MYDSRVAFALNWLIFINRWHTEDNGNMKFFRQPNGRNGNIKKYSQETIFNFKYKNFDENDDFYYKKNETYDKYCELLNGVCAFCKSSRYEGNIDNISVGLLEMCLFSIAAKNNQKGSIKSNYEEETRFITDDMCKRIHITIDQN